MWVYSTPVSHHHMQSFQAVREGTHSLVMPATACLCHIHLPSSSHYSCLLLPVSAIYTCLHHLITHTCYCLPLPHSSSHYSCLLLTASAAFIISFLMPATDCLCHHLSLSLRCLLRPAFLLPRGGGAGASAGKRGQHWLRRDHQHAGGVLAWQQQIG